jgi:uncharacterized protein
MTNWRMAHCYRCGYSWFPRKVHVRLCAHCKSPYFDIPKVRVPSYGGGLGIDDVIGAHRTAVLRIARQHGAENVRVFGSVARRRATSSSDVDLLVDPMPHRRFRQVDLSLRLSRLLGRPVDVVSESGLDWFLQPKVITEAVPL